jgi:general stress protein YciG
LLEDKVTSDEYVKNETLVTRINNLKIIAKDDPMTDKPKAKRGFAVMNPELQRSIAAKGGSAVPAEKRTFAVDATHARECGRLGGFAKSQNAAKRESLARKAVTRKDS